MIMLFRFKSTLTDFLVDEQLPYSLHDQGTHFFVHIQKQAKTTMEIIDHLRRKLSLPKNLIGYAGLKDKKGITRQRLSFDGEAMQKRMQVKYRDHILLSSLKEVCSVLETGRYHKPLSLRDDFHNHFTLILRATKHLSQHEKQMIQTILTKLLHEKIPNFFGTQRFGINGRNIKQAKQILEGKRGDIVWFDRKFKLQALASHLFNLTLKTRIEKNPHGLIDGDFLLIEKQLYCYHHGNLYLQQFGKQHLFDRHDDLSVHAAPKAFFVESTITGSAKPFSKEMEYEIMLPVLGYNSLIANYQTDMGKYFRLFLKRQEINEKSWQLFKDLEIFGIMRSVFIQCINPTREWIGDDIKMEFRLPAGAYASVVVDRLTEQLHEKLK